jgi:hypothetical protein
VAAPSFPLVTVKWNDAHTAEATQYAPSDVPHAPLVIETVGWLLREDASGVSLANERLDNSQYRGYTFVPAGMIVSITPIIKPRPKRARSEVKNEVPRPPLPA